jgi:hypothetical protein
MQQRLGNKLVIDAMKVHPWSIHELVSKLEALGIVVVNSNGDKKLIEVTSDKPDSRSFQAKARARRKPSAVPAPSPAKGDAQGNSLDIDSDDLVPSKYWTLDGLSITIISQRLLAVAEPATLSVANLKVISKKGQALQNIQNNIRMLEYMTGLPPDFSLTGIYRSWAKVTQLVCERNDSRGRRCRDIQLPINFDTVGIYSMEDQGTFVVVKHLFTEQEEKYDPKELPNHRSMKCLYISSNWSEVRAAISSESDPLQKSDVMLLARFCKHTVVEEKSQLALEDAKNVKDKKLVVEQATSVPSKRTVGKTSPSSIVPALAKRARTGE